MKSFVQHLKIMEKPNPTFLQLRPAKQDRDVSPACTNDTGGVPQQACSPVLSKLHHHDHRSMGKVEDVKGVATPRVDVIPRLLLGI